MITTILIALGSNKQYKIDYLFKLRSSYLKNRYTFVQTYFPFLFVSKRGSY